MNLKHMSFSRHVADQSVALLEGPKFGIWTF